jgi:hypothetical protein
MILWFNKKCVKPRCSRRKCGGGGSSKMHPSPPPPPPPPPPHYHRPPLTLHIESLIEFPMRMLKSKLNKYSAKYIYFIYLSWWCKMEISFQSLAYVSPFFFVYRLPIPTFSQNYRNSFQGGAFIVWKIYVELVHFLMNKAFDTYHDLFQAL